jgi:hypothetical protein
MPSPLRGLLSAKLDQPGHHHHGQDAPVRHSARCNVNDASAMLAPAFAFEILVMNRPMAI